MVSIHAPAWGATVGIRPSFSVVSGFNPRTRVGCDENLRIKSEDGESFNPRTRVGCDPQPWKVGLQVTSFNPRTRVGCDQTFPDPLCTIEEGVSIHAPAWGATDWREHWTEREIVSIHAPAWGATLEIYKNVNRPQRFNPRTRGGCDFSSAICLFNSSVSIHAPAWGAT